MRTFNLDWRGWAEADGLRARAGIYCVWAGLVRRRTDGTLYIDNSEAKLVYIGESANISDRVANHEKSTCWRSERPNQDYRVVFTHVALPTANVGEGWRQAAENCLIATHKPPCNTDDLTYHYDKSVVINNTGVTFGKLRSQHKCKGSDDPDDR